MTESGRRMAEILIKVRESAGSTVGGSLQNIDHDIGASVISFRSEDDTSEKNNNPDKIKNGTTEASFTTSFNLPAKRTSFLTSDRQIHQSNNIPEDEPSWLEGLLNGEMEINSEKEINCNKRKNTSSKTTNKKFLYCYITDTGNESNDQNNAEIDIEKSVCYLICCLLGKLNLGAFLGVWLGVNGFISNKQSKY